MIAIEIRGWRIALTRVPRSLAWLRNAMRREQQQAERNLQIHQARSEASRRGWVTRKARKARKDEQENPALVHHHRRRQIAALAKDCIDESGRS